jgi:hypothetical protein
MQLHGRLSCQKEETQMNVVLTRKCGSGGEGSEGGGKRKECGVEGSE